jgi:cell division protein FtsX
LALRLGWSTLRSRPTLTVLAILLLGLGTGLLGALVGTTKLLHDLQTNYLSALTLEVELQDESAALREQIMGRLETWPGLSSLQFVGKEQVLAELQRETTDDLLRLFGFNPFPALIRVQFTHTNLSVLDSLSAAVRTEPGVRAVTYPRELWTKTSNLMSRLQGDVGLFAVVLALLSVGLVGLCMRAQVRNRASTWELLSLLGLSDRSFGHALLVQELCIGVGAGLLACALLWSLSVLFSWVFIRAVSFDFWFYVLIVLAAISLALLAGLFTPRRRYV